MCKKSHIVKRLVYFSIVSLLGTIASIAPLGTSTVVSTT